MRAIDDIISDVIRREDPKYTDHPLDSGGPTKYGITLRTLTRWLQRAATPADVRSLTETDARAIYRQMFVEDPGFGPLLGISRAVAIELIDTGVNTGPPIATQMLQRALNALNRNQRDYADIAVDGACGMKTQGALVAFLRHRGAEGERVLVAALNCQQGERYIAIAERRPKDEEFLYGWLRARVLS